MAMQMEHMKHILVIALAIGASWMMGILDEHEPYVIFSFVVSRLDCLLFLMAHIENST